MTLEEFYTKRELIFQFCERNNLNHDWSETAHEMDFVSDRGMEAIDLLTLENPTCINVDAFIIVELPTVDPSKDNNRYHYHNIAYGLMEVCRPDYILGVHDGIVTSVCYAVWSEQKRNYQDYFDGIDSMLVKAGGYMLLKKEYQPLVILSDGNGNAKETKIKSILRMVESKKEFMGIVTELVQDIKVIDWDDEMWDLEDYTDTENIRKIYSAACAEMNARAKTT